MLRICRDRVVTEASEVCLGFILVEYWGQMGLCLLGKTFEDVLSLCEEVVEAVEFLFLSIRQCHEFVVSLGGEDDLSRELLLFFVGMTFDAYLLIVFGK